MCDSRDLLLITKTTRTRSGPDCKGFNLEFLKQIQKSAITHSAWVITLTRRCPVDCYSLLGVDKTNEIFIATERGCRRT